VKASINANRANFTDFDSVKDAYVEFKPTDNLTNDPKTQQVASVAHGGSGAGITHADMTKDMDPRPMTNTRRDLFPNLKSTSRPTFLSVTIQMQSLTN
jgi:hypothetical protein